MCLLHISDSCTEEAILGSELTENSGLELSPLVWFVSVFLDYCMVYIYMASNTGFPLCLFSFCNEFAYLSFGTFVKFIEKYSRNSWAFDTRIVQ